MSMGIRPHARRVPSEPSLADAPSRNQVAKIKFHFSTSALAQVSDLNSRDNFQDEAEAKRGKKQGGVA